MCWSVQKGLLVLDTKTSGTLANAGATLLDTAFPFVRRA